MQVHHSVRRVQYQAITEVVIGLVGLTALFLGLVTIATAGHTSLANLMGARGAAEQRMGGNTVVLTEYVQDWISVPGDDGLSFTRDDTAVHAGGSPAAYAAALAIPIPLSSLETNPNFGLKTAITPFLSGTTLTVAADLRDGTREDTLAVDPGLAYLLGCVLTRLTFKDRVVMPGLRIGNGVNATP